MRKFLDALKDAHKRDDAAEARYRQIETELSTMKGQIKTRS
jgi:hypothetical protein